MIVFLSKLLLKFMIFSSPAVSAISCSQFPLRSQKYELKFTVKFLAIESNVSTEIVEEGIACGGLSD